MVDKTNQSPDDGRKSVDSAIKVLETQEYEGVNVDMAQVMANHAPNPWGKGYMKLYALVGLMFLNSTMNGFDTSVMSSINAIPNYIAYYDLPEKGAASTGIVFAIWAIGQMVGSLFTWLCDWKGRKFMIFFGAIGVLIGTIIVATAPTLGAFIGGRFILAFFATLAHLGAIIYLVEIAPTKYRGTVAGLYNTFYYFGSILATSSVYGAHLHLSHIGNLDWRLALWLQMICPGFVACGILFFPESPRWLVMKDRHEEARDILTKYHANGEPNHPLVELEIREMLTSLRDEPPVSDWKTMFDLRQLVKTRGRRYRLMLNMVFAWFGQFSGNNVISYFLPSLLTNVGITSTNMKLLLNIVYAIVGWIFSTAGTRFHDIIGRRKMFLISTAGMVICLAITSGTAADFVNTGNKASSTASIAFIYVFGAVFSFAYTSMQPIYPSEIISTDARAKGVMCYKLTSGASSFLNIFVTPIALQNIGYWFYVFFVFWDVFEFIYIYFFFVETKGISLEELDAIFEAPNPRKASTAVKRVQARTLVTSDGEVTQEVKQV